MLITDNEANYPTESYSVYCLGVKLDAFWTYDWSSPRAGITLNVFATSSIGNE